jgi:hypothetical protein
VTGCASSHGRETTSLKTRHSARMALRKRPNYAEPEEWEVEDPIYPSNTIFRTASDLSEPERKTLLAENTRFKATTDIANNFSLPKDQRHRGLIGSFWVCQGTEINLPMFPTFRALVRDKIREFETKLQEGCSMDPRLQVLFQEAMDATKKALANAHRSPYYNAAV